MGQAEHEVSPPSVVPSEESELAIFKAHRPRVLRPVAAVRLSMVSLPESTPEREHTSSTPAALSIAREPEEVGTAEPIDLDAQLLAILSAGPALGETIEAAFRRKEHELGALFATLDVTTSRALHRRLSRPAEGDLVAAQFGRMVSERRARLLSFLADARRREAIAQARSYDDEKR